MALAAAAEKERLALELEAKYNSIIKEADIAFNAKDYSGSRDKYQNALNLKSAASYPKAKIDEVNKKWDRFLYGKELSRQQNEFVEPLIAAEFDQGIGWNQFCPEGSGIFEFAIYCNLLFSNFFLTSMCGS